MKTLTNTRPESTATICSLFSNVLREWLNATALVQWAAIRAAIWMSLLMLSQLALPAATFTVTTLDDSGAGSLRQAILDANSSPGADVILFDIAAGTRTILPTNQLPTITDPVVIDGSSQAGYVDHPLIDLNGSVAGSSAIGLLVTGGGSTIRGLAIHNFGSNGIQLQTKGGNKVEACFIGTEITGTQAFGNGGRGVYVLNSPTNTIGGFSISQRNLISGNSSAGIRIEGASSTNNLVQGNFIGTDVTGTSKIGNNNGITVSGASRNIIGGSATSIRNVISGNNGNGLTLLSGATDNIVAGNYIGLDATGARLLGNGSRGVHILDTATVRNVIGGPGAGNVIAGNGGSGIKVENGASRNALLANNIFANADIGIRLGNNYVTSNDPGDVDSGSNGFQNYPVLNSAMLSQGALSTHGTLDSSSNGTFRIEFFASDVCDFSGYGEGQIFLGAIQIVTDGSGHANFDMAFAAPANRFHFVTATATDSGNNTSEFSRSVLVGGVGCAIESTFDNTAHGWLIWNNDGTFQTGTWTNAGGNPGGYLSRSDNGGDGRTAFWQAPAQFLGQQAAAYGGYLEFDLKQSATDSQYHIADVMLIGGGLQLVLDTTVNPTTTWTPYRVFLHEAAGWRVGSRTGPVATEAQLRMVLGSLSVLRIRAEYRRGSDTDGLDNVRLVFPTPTLTMRKLGNALSVEWPAAASCFQLESTETLSPPAWTPVIASIETTNGVNRVPAAPASGMRFYRLKK